MGVVVTLDPSVLDLVEAHPREWVVRVDGCWGDRGMVAGVTPRWYFRKDAVTWYYITEQPDAKNRRTGSGRWDLEPSSLPGFPRQSPVETGELVHMSLTPPEVQFWAAGFRPDPGAAAELREEGGKQESLTGWSA